MGRLDDTAFTDVYREGPPPPPGHQEPPSVGGREDPPPAIASVVDDERTTSGGGALREIMNHAGDARRSGEHRCEYERPAAGPQAAGSAALLRERPHGSWEPQRSYTIGVRSNLEGFGRAGSSWIAGRGDL